MWTVALLLALARPPCLLDELDLQPAIETPPDPQPAPQPEATPAPPPVPAPPPPAPAPPPPVPANPSPSTPAPVPSPDPAAPARSEVAEYNLSFGILGQVGEVTISLSPAITEPADRTVRLLGHGKGSILGLGATEKRVDSEFDARALGSRRWVSFRAQGKKVVTDTVVQDEPGAVSLVRQRPGQPDEPDAFTRAAPVHDPLSFLARLRLAPPRAPETFEVLDGRGLWIVTVAPGRAAAGRRELRLDGKASPVFWDGSPDPERDERRFSLWLADDAYRTPVRLVVPTALGEVRADLARVSRTAIARAPAAGPTVAAR